MKSDRWTEFFRFGCILLLAAGVRLVIAAEFYNPFDLTPYNIPWAIGMGKYGFSVYSMLENLDYPPLFPFLLWSVARPVALAEAAQDRVMLMFWIKLWPVLFDLGLTALLWWRGRRKSETFGLTMALCWALNPSAIFNCAVWGQTDSLLMFFIVLCAAAFWDRRPVLGTVWFAVGCLAKLQMAYFAPVLLLELFVRYRPKKAVTALLSGIGVGVLGWLPFMIGSRSLTLPFDIYFGGFDKYNYLDLNAFNVYGIFSANWVPDQLSIFGGTVDAETGLRLGGFTFAHLNTIVTLLLLGGVCFGYWAAKKYRAQVPFFLHGLYLLNGIFILSTKMHERYQMPVLILVMLCVVFGTDLRYRTAALILTQITFFNQVLLLFYRIREGWEPAFTVGQPLVSALNVALFAVLTVWYFKACTGKGVPLSGKKRQ